MKRPFVFHQHMFTPWPYGLPGFYITHPFILLFFLLLALYFIPFLFSIFLSLHPSTKAHDTGFMCPGPLSLVMSHVTKMAFRKVSLACNIHCCSNSFLFLLPAYRLYINYHCYQIITLRVRKFLHKSGTVWNVEWIHCQTSLNPLPSLEHDILNRQPQITVSFLAVAWIFLNVLLGSYIARWPITPSNNPKGHLNKTQMPENEDFSLLHSTIHGLLSLFAFGEIKSTDYD